MVEDLVTHIVKDTFRHRHVVVPASVLKLVTTGVALETLGPSFRFPTYLEYSGNIIGDTLRGNLYIRGTCDPSLGSPVSKRKLSLSNWVSEIKKSGIRYIAGSVVADMSFLDHQAYNPSWLFEDAGNYYAPGIYGINYLSNTMNIVLKAGEEDGFVHVLRTEPHIDSLHFINEVRCIVSGHVDGVFVHGLPRSNERYLYGSVLTREGLFGVKGDIPNPGLLLAQKLVEQLSSAGVQAEKDASYIIQAPISENEKKEKRHIICTHYSDSLGVIIAETNSNSNNLYAEALFRYLGTLYKVPGTIHNSIRFVTDFWKARGLDLHEMIIKDGSGLAPQNAISANAIVGILAHMERSRYRDVWLSSLSVCGVNGTLESFFKNTPLEGIVYAKSGTISSTRNMAGYMKSTDGHLLAFAILINGTYDKARRLQKPINNYLLDVYQGNDRY